MLKKLARKRLLLKEIYWFYHHVARSFAVALAQTGRIDSMSGGLYGVVGHDGCFWTRWCGCSARDSRLSRRGLARRGFLEQKKKKKKKKAPPFRLIAPVHCHHWPQPSLGCVEERCGHPRRGALPPDRAIGSPVQYIARGPWRPGDGPSRSRPAGGIGGRGCRRRRCCHRQRQTSRLRRQHTGAQGLIA